MSPAHDPRPLDEHVVERVSTGSLPRVATDRPGAPNGGRGGEERAALPAADALGPPSGARAFLAPGRILALTRATTVGADVLRGGRVLGSRLVAGTQVVGFRSRAHSTVLPAGTRSHPTA